MSYFAAKMHQIRFRLGLCPDPAGGAYSAPQTPSWIWGGLLLREGRGWKSGGDERGGDGGEGRGGEGRRRKGRGGLSGNVAEEAFCLKSAPAREDMHTNCINLVVTALSQWISSPIESLMHVITYPLLSVLLVYPLLVELLGTLILEMFWNVIVVNLKGSC